MNAILAIFAKPMGLIITAIYQVIGSYGWTLVILTVLVKVALYPLYAKQIKSTSAMSTMQPKIKEIQNKYKDDPSLQQRKLQEFYAEQKINPMSGCWPMVVQMIVIMGLFTLLRNPIKYIGGSEDLLYAVHQSFFWIPDLCQPDRWILPIAAAIATYIAFTMNQQNQLDVSTGSSNPNMNMGGMMKVMKYVFPVMILLMARSYPAALAVYWFLSQVIQIAYNLRFRRIREDLAEDQRRKEERRKERKK